MSEIAATALCCECHDDPLGIDVLHPRLSWQCSGAARGAVQSAYQIVVAGSKPALASGPYLWDTGKVISDDSIQHPYAGAPLRARQACWWRVRVWDGADQPSDWSETAYWEMGLLGEFLSQARWIGVPWAEDTSRAQPCPYLRREFRLPPAPAAIVAARLYVTSLGLYHVMINGEPITEDLFTPGWTSYRHRLQYQAYDVAALLAPGPNAIGVVLGDGWLRGHLGFVVARNLFGDRLGLLLQLEVRYADGSLELVTSDEHWTASTGPLLQSDLYHAAAFFTKWLGDLALDQWPDGRVPHVVPDILQHAGDMGAGSAAWADAAAPGYRRAIVRPRPGGGLSWAYARLDTIIGEYSAGWSQREGRMRVALTVPSNGHAEVHLPDMQLAHVFERDVPVTAAPATTVSSIFRGEGVGAQGAWTVSSSHPFWFVTPCIVTPAWPPSRP